MPYKAIINGKTYNTETATEICDIDSRASGGDFRWHSTRLYRTKKGAFFVAGRGGPMSMWAEPAHGGGITGGSGVRPVSASEARDYMEAADCDEGEFLAAGLPVEEA